MLVIEWRFSNTTSPVYRGGNFYSYVIMVQEPRLYTSSHPFYFCLTGSHFAVERRLVISSYFLNGVTDLT